VLLIQLKSNKISRYINKKNEIMLFEGKWMELGNIMLNEGSQTQKCKSHMFSLICRS
jgi:hypothetical protein